MSLGRVFSPLSLKPWSSKCRSIRSSHGAIQPPPDSRKPTRSLGCRSHTPPQIMLSAAALEAVDADRRHAARPALVEADDEIEVFRGAPERLVSCVMDQPVVV